MNLFHILNNKKYDLVIQEFPLLPSFFHFRYIELAKFLCADHNDPIFISVICITHP